MNRRSGAGRRDGFTLLEILVVIIIISILASLVLIGVTKALGTSRASNTETLIRMIDGALESYRVRWGDYPPSSLESFKVRMPNETNNGIEALIACLSSKQRGDVFWQPSSDELYVNTDRDSLAKNPTGWFFGDNQLREVTDYFGNTLTYLHHRDYAKPAPSMLKYIFRSGSAIQQVQPVTSGQTKTFANPGKFQIFSPGPDGKAGTPDDIRGW